MAHLFLSVADFQLTIVQNDPLPKEREEAEHNGTEAPDHVLTVWEHGTPNRLSVRLGEVEALEVVGLWMALETPSEPPSARERIVKLCGARVAGWMFP